jgi:hypothetical protein
MEIKVRLVDLVKISGSLQDKDMKKIFNAHIH